jgi:hypothetical protein
MSPPPNAGVPRGSLYGGFWQAPPLALGCGGRCRGGLVVGRCRDRRSGWRDEVRHARVGLPHQDDAG